MSRFKFLRAKKNLNLDKKRKFLTPIASNLTPHPHPFPLERLNKPTPHEFYLKTIPSLHRFNDFTLLLELLDNGFSRWRWGGIETSALLY